MADTETKRVLVVDDVGYNRVILKRLLQKEGLEVDEAPDGQEALHLLGTKRYDLVITDLMMPEMDGMELIERARSEKRFDDLGEMPCPPFIVCSAFVDEKGIEDAKERGIAGVIHKPVDPSGLISLVAEVFAPESDDSKEIVVSISPPESKILRKLAGQVNARPEKVLAVLLAQIDLSEIEEKVRSLESLKKYLEKGATWVEEKQVETGAE